jgi:hypothetical protein
MGGPFCKSEMGGLLRIWQQGMYPRAAEQLRLLSVNSRREIRRILSVSLMGFYAGILHVSHFIFKKRASHALITHLCKILTGHCWHDL